MHVLEQEDGVALLHRGGAGRVCDADSEPCVSHQWCRGKGKVEMGEKWREAEGACAGSGIAEEQLQALNPAGVTNRGTGGLEEVGRG